jgi:hypothetical protein
MTSYVVHIDDVQEVEGAYPAPFDAEKLSIYKDLGRAAGSKRLGFSFERLLPGAGPASLTPTPTKKSWSTCSPGRANYGLWSRERSHGRSPCARGTR